MARLRPGMNGVLMAVAALLCGQIVLLTVQNRSLRTRLAEATTSDSLPEGTLAVGDFLDPIRVVGGQGGDGELTTFVGETSSLVLFFREECPACQRTLPVWSDQLPGLASRGDVRIVAIDLDRSGGAEPAERPFPVFGIDPDDRRTISRQIPVVPAAVFVGGDGVVDAVWFGVPDPEDIEQMTQMLGSIRAG